MASGYTASFGKNKGGLSSVKWALLDEDGVIFEGWNGEVSELQPNTGIYYIYETFSSSAVWLVFKTDEPAPDNLYLILGLQEKGIVFYFGETHTGKTISYQFFTEFNVPVGPVIPTDFEFENSGIYLPLNVVIPTNAVFVKAVASGVPAEWIAGAVDFDMTIYTQVPRTGPIAEEVVT